MRLVRLAAFAFLLLAPVSTIADPAPIISDFATARPVVARHGMVVSQEAAASRVGLDVLEAGGNAVDAAVAVGFALAVTLPRAGNLGGGGFMLIHRADLGKTVAIDYRETAPAATTKDVFLDANGEADPFKSRWSGLADRRARDGRRARARLAQIRLGQIRLRRTRRSRHRARPAGPDRRRRCRRHAAGRRADSRQTSLVGAHLSEARRRRPAGRRPHRARRSRRDARDDRSAGRGGFLRGAGRAEDRRRRAGGGRAHDDGRSRALSRGRARAGQRDLSRARDRLDAAALFGGRACRSRSSISSRVTP